MKSTLSLTLILAVMTPALPVTAQEQVTSLEPAGPIHHAVEREAARLAAIEPLASSQGGRSISDSVWSRVRKLAPGTEIVITIKDASPARRYLITTNESELMVLNIADPAFPRAARDVLRDLIPNYVDYFRAAREGGQFLIGEIGLFS